MTRDYYNVDNNGNNTGLMIAQNTAPIYLSYEKVKKIPSLIPLIIQSLGDICSDDIIENTANLQAFKPDKKIEYNCILKYKDIIKKYAAYYYKCEQYLNAFDNSNIRSKTKILNWINLRYLKAKGTILAENKDSGKEDIEIIQQNSDKLIEILQEQIYETIINSEKFSDIYREDIDLGIACFICFCFMKCKILEKPL